MAASASTVPSTKLILTAHGRPDISAELVSLKFQKQNKNLPRVPANFQIQRRPLLHPPVASPYAGKDVQKVVYVSRKTPVMSAVKRVKKILMHVEKRAMQNVNLTGGRDGMKQLAAANEKLAKDGEKVYVKASGRAMEQALRVAEWFRRKEDEIRCHVEVTTGSVQAIDDLVETKGDDERKGEDGSELKTDEDPTMDTFLNLVTSKTMDKSTNATGLKEDSVSQHEGHNDTEEAGKANHDAGRRRRKRKRPEYDQGDIPEARIRWIKTIEIAISLKA